MSKLDVDILEKLRPTQSNRIIDLVVEAGIDVSKWSINKDGIKVEIPATNPSYCSDWSFGGNDETTLLCVWHRSIEVENELILFKDNLQQRALDIEFAAEKKNPKEKSKAARQARRARNFNRLILNAFQAHRPVKVVVLGSNMEIKDKDEPPKYRLLDSEDWFVHDYQMQTGRFCLVRSEPVKVMVSDAESDKIVDQFLLSNYGDKRDSTTSVYIRNPEVRKAVLTRASGVCELCKEPGFRIKEGLVFLETHHVIPLAENGLDVEWNVVAICPNDHRKAHYAENKDDIRLQLKAILVKFYPEKFLNTN